MIRLFLAAMLVALSSHAQATEAGWALLRNGGQVVLMRHANAPGTGEPARFDIEQCATQRNLSERGRQQARRIGALFAARAAPLDEVLTSRFCRARDTAVLAFGATAVEEFEALDYLSGEDDETRAARLDQITERANDFTGSGNLVMMTHGEIIFELVGVNAREGEAVILSRTGETPGVAGRITFN